MNFLKLLWYTHREQHFKLSAEVEQRKAQDAVAAKEHFERLARSVRFKRMRLKS